MAYDRDKLRNAVDANDFRLWMVSNGFDCRQGKGPHQLFQVKLSDSWTAISVSEKGQVTSAPELRDLIGCYRNGISLHGKLLTAKKPEFKQLPPTAKANQYLSDLRDDFAMAAMKGIFANEAQLLRYGDVGTRVGNTTMQVVAEAAYMMADAMLAERAK